MLYDGKRPTELTDEELTAALDYCQQARANAEAVWRLNGAGLEELNEEQERRRKRAMN